jgi:predicted aminopeptidase
MLIAFVALSFAALAAAQESAVQLKDGPGKDKTMACVACHSLDYIQMNSRFMSKAAWTGSVNKMINVYGAPIDKADVDTIATYLAQHYGVQP